MQAAVPEEQARVPEVAQVGVGSGLEVLAFTGGGGEDFWLGQKLGTVGSSKGRRVKVNWLAAVGGVYTFEQQADYVKESRVVSPTLTLAKSGNGWLLAVGDRKRIEEKLAVKIDDTSSDEDAL